jgi:hypothetical protein
MQAHYCLKGGLGLLVSRCLSLTIDVVHLEFCATVKIGTEHEGKRGTHGVEYLLRNDGDSKEANGRCHGLSRLRNKNFDRSIFHISIMDHP